MLKNEILNKAEEVVNLLKTKGLTIATAESCTGGLVSSYITAVSGASDVFELGVTSYSCKIKNEILNVPKEVLNEQGAICKETAKFMAENVRIKADSDLGVSVTGVAGPNKSEGKQAGLVYIAISSTKNTLVKELNITPKSRDFVRQTAALNIFDLIMIFVEEL